MLDLPIIIVIQSNGATTIRLVSDRGPGAANAECRKVRPVSVEPLGSIRQHLEVGDQDAARRELVAALRANPQDVSCWELLATLLDDPARKADCYRQILRIDPQHSHAAASLAALTSAPPSEPVHDVPAVKRRPALRCQGCGGTLDIRFIGEMRDKRAVCPFCGNEVDLPDSFQRVERQRDHEQRPWGSRTVDTVYVETRVDHGSEGQPAHPVPDIDTIRQTLQEEGPTGLDEETLQKLDDAGFTVSTSATAGVRTYLSGGLESGADTLLDRSGVDSFDGEFKFPTGKVVFSPEDVSSVQGRLDPEHVIRMAGGAPPVEKRTKCPECEAIVPRDASRCEWCGAGLAEIGNN
jgi:hypothetical protein